MLRESNEAVDVEKVYKSNLLPPSRTSVELPEQGYCSPNFHLVLDRHHAEADYRTLDQVRHSSQSFI